MEKVVELAEPNILDDLYSALELGIHAFHSYKKGQSGFERA